MFDVGERSWSWDVNLAHGRNQAEQENRGSYNARNIAIALGNPAVCAATPGCTPLDIFGFNTITPEMLAFISPVFRDSSENTLTLGSANLSGELFDMPAGALAFATGVEYRQYEGSYDPDPQTVRGEYNGVPSQPTFGEYNVSEVYVELDVPLLADSAWAKKLNLNVAGRYSDYSTFGGEFVPKYGLRWQVAEEFLLRSTYAEGFRARRSASCTAWAPASTPRSSIPAWVRTSLPTPRTAPCSAWRPVRRSSTRRSASRPAATACSSRSARAASRPVSCGARR